MFNEEKIVVVFILIWFGGVTKISTPERNLKYLHVYFYIFFRILFSDRCPNCNMQ